MTSDALPLLSIRGVGKTYAQPVLAEIDLQLFGGEVLALTGENGAGKSTLSKIVGGLERPGAGSLELLGRPYAPASRREAEALGVRMVMQELNLLPTLSVAENLFLHDLPRRAGWIDRRRLRAAAREAMAQVGLEAIDPDTLVGDLGIGHQQMVEIARNLIGDCRLLILDEPTAMLTAREVDMLFEQVERLRERGVAIVYISHRLEELARISQRIAVLRDGRLVCVEPIERYDADQLVTLMVGRELGERFDLGPRQIGAPLLRVERLSRRGKVHEVSFEVRAGEIFGISGLIGSGRTELLRLIYGADRADGGQVLLGDPPQRLSLRSPADSVRQGVALITEDRKGEGLLLDQSISANLALGNLPALARHGVIDRRREEALARRQVEALRVRCADTAQAVGELSGGNQQKVVIGRWLERDCQVLLFDEPTRGIDVGAKFDIYALLAELTRRGKGAGGGVQRPARADADLRSHRRALGGTYGGHLRARRLDPGRAAGGGLRRLQETRRAAGDVVNTQRKEPEMSDPTSSATAAAAPTLRRGNYFGLGTYLGLAGALLAMIALFSALSSHFLSYGTFLAIANQIPDLVVLAVGMTFILIVGGIDLSVGSVLALAASAVSLATLGWGWGVLPAAMLGMACATLAGCVTGSITVAWRIPSFIVSLGVLEMARGLAYQMTDSRTAYIGDAYAWLSNPLAFGISPAFVIALLVMFAAQAVLTRTVFGRYLIGIGTNEEAVRLAGVNPKPYKIAVFALMGLLAGLAALFQISRLEAADPNAGVGLELQVIAAVVIGGTSLMGGRGSVVSTFFGVLIISVLAAGLAQIGASEPTKRIITGAVIVVAVVLDTYRSHRARRQG